MAGYSKISRYSCRSVIPNFMGMMQYGDGNNIDLSYATTERNVETFGGVLQPAAACELMEVQLDQPIETLARLYRRWYSGDDDKEILIAASGGKLYYMLLGANSWTQLAMPTGVTSYSSNVWSWVTYEINPQGSSASVDVLLMSNAVDGMIMIRGDNMTVSKVTTPKKFGVIERYAERIWGGAITDDPDMLVYSAPYDPTDWAANVEHPEDGAGDIMQPSWDGDSFTALKAFGSQLIAFKKNRVWRVLGTDPGEYTFKEQYGGGATYPGTVAVNNEIILMLSKKGPQIYDGLSVSPYKQEYCKEIWAQMNLEELDKATAVYWHNKYYCAFPLGGSKINNAVVIFNPIDGTWLIRDDVYVESFLGMDDELLFTSSTTPGRVWRWREDSWKTGASTNEAIAWVTPWTDAGAKDIAKNGFDVYLLCEVKTEPVTLWVSIQTETKVKSRNFTVKPLSEAEIAANKWHKQKCLHFSGACRRFRLIIETQKRTAPWRLIGGVVIISDTDPD